VSRIRAHTVNALPLHQCTLFSLMTLYCICSRYRILATSGEFCIGAQQDGTDCESVQFISGLELEEAPGGSLLLSYGINDCEAKLARMPMDAVWTMLSPLVGETDVCA
jgi:hypothetical protein